ncbi:hypothetical protein FB45DRAFT_821739 [Roridomyces roridus]|uniref:NFX1-type zinc finger-containing protein 1 n=1 Tax=Roridomyces roridus TaxID=1738132 RepID=A0AAD7CEU2_9AGAR|nr:hypothetical protein FB45DRAFT_821739 [Roridomyces roridus]
MPPNCRFFNKPGGCNRGDQCTFSHSEPSASPAPRAPLPRAPLGTCNFFWSTGSCRHEYKCRYKHVLLSQSPAPEPTADTANPLAPFLTAAGLAKLNAPGADVFFPPSPKSLSPAEIHNHLKTYLREGFKFIRTFNAYGFLEILASIDPSNSRWAPEDGPLLLTSLATGNGLLRINDIFCWLAVSSRAGSNALVLSFQRGYLPLLKFYSSEFVLKSTLNHLVNGLYMRILDNFDVFSTNLSKCMEDCLEARSFIDRMAALSESQNIGSQVISSLAVVFFEILTRFKDAVARYPHLAILVRNLQTWTETWIEGVKMTPPAFDDPFREVGATARDQIIEHLRTKVKRLVTIVDREQDKIERSNRKHITPLFIPSDTNHEGVVAALSITYEGPGNLRAQGPRHDNDFPDILDIRIAPTHDELTSKILPFLPGNLHGAPHHLPPESMERLLDIQFRLLREELTAPLRTSVQLVRADLESPSPRTMLGQLMEKRGGKYRGYMEGHGQDQAMFNLYTNVAFSPLVPDRRGLSVGLTIDTPPGHRARHPQPRERIEFWRGVSGKRLIQGGLVALVWKTERGVDIHLGIISSGLKDLTESAGKGHGATRVDIRVVFFDSAVELRILNELKNPEHAEIGTKVLVEAPVMFETIRPFLEALRVEPESLPFARYLVHQAPGVLETVQISPPRYALIPGFTYQIASLFPPEAGIDDLKLDVSDPNSVALVRDQLKTSRLDASQGEAVLDALTRELAMIQGPPGTGKSYTGVEILRVLLANNIRPILMIAFTNHALDAILTSVLDAGITKKVVRLGSRSADERISQYSMETVEMVAGQSRLDRSFREHYRDLKEVQDEIKTLMKSFTAETISSQEIESYLRIQYAEHFEHLCIIPPDWVRTLRRAHHHDDSGGAWMRTGRNGTAEAEDDSWYAFWRDAEDLDFLDSSLRQQVAQEKGIEDHNRFSALDADETNVSSSDGADKGEEEEEGSGDSEDEDLGEVEPWEREQWLVGNAPPIEAETLDISAPIPPPAILIQPRVPAPRPDLPVQAADILQPQAFFGGPIPTIPDSNRPLDTLLAEGTLWSFSRGERQRLHRYWSVQIKERRHETHLEDFRALRDKHEDILKKDRESKDEIRRSLLQEIDIVGCTTNGAAKLTSLLKSLSPRVMLVEEAGQVLEAHILGSLVPSVEHLILIGDPQQLRPTLNNYSLSMDNPRGGQLYKFDMSLMERLASNRLAMSQINVQRRMRPQISSLIRNALYPALQDHRLVTEYPDVRGFSKNVFFLSHSHRENDGAEESSSKYNTFEVNMIKDLVLYLLRQGCYSEDGDIVVLCAYLGQLARVRDALASEVAVIIDGRDKDNLAEQEEEKEGGGDGEVQVEHVQVTKRVRLRTVDNYQGEEAKIVILSTVRNAGSNNDPNRAPGRIGFLASENRTNVALSRAKEGLFILGNAAQLASRSKMWQTVTEELSAANCLGPAFPVACSRHPDSVELISQPGKLPLFAPDGGCLRPCDYRLKCGHTCNYKCHSDDPNHVTISCPQPCRRLCPRMHPCNKKCEDECECTEQCTIELPCGHTASVECHLLDNLEDIACTELVLKSLPSCEHSARMLCSTDPSEVPCTSACAGIMHCCGRSCAARCHDCQRFHPQTEGRIERTMHSTHPCQKILFCAHTCNQPCSVDHECAKACQESCRMECSHSRCKSYCSKPCSPCMKPCDWVCPHGKCPLPCGSICARLPCDRPCPQTLECGHKCPSVCGEDCSIQVCPMCASNNVKQDIVDLVMYRKLEDVQPAAGTLDELLITLPKCGHVFTVETLDGHCGMTDFYTRDESADKWLGLRSPDLAGETKPAPVCPTCRSGITSPRYGRVFKSAALDILEKNVISNMTQNLNKLQGLMAGIDKERVNGILKDQSGRINIPTADPSNKKQRQARIKARRKVLNTSLDLPVPLDSLVPSNKQLHFVSPAVANAWQQATRHLTTMYAEALKVAKTRSAHTKAWEAAFSTLHEQEMNAAAENPAQAPRQPKEYAVRMAKMKVGQPKPQADKRFVVEAFWATLQLRFVLGDLARTWMEDLVKKQSSTFSTDERQKWGSFGFFVLDSCLRDADRAYAIAEESGSRRQMTVSVLLIMRAQLDRFRFNLDMVRASGMFQAEQPKLLSTIEKAIETADGRVAETVRDHGSVLRNDRQTWIPENFSNTAFVIIEEWRKLEKSVRLDTFYEPVSLDERMSVVRALNFSHVGHFYTCPNGHVYVIDDCGGAMMRSSCPECGATIGGSNHTLEASNRPAAEFEDIARQSGSQPSPWAWNRV